jgi:hypothetical protein
MRCNGGYRQETRTIEASGPRIWWCREWFRLRKYEVAPL